MDFEGRPDINSVLGSGKEQRFELKTLGHAAIVQYRINAEWNVYFWIASWLGASSGCGFAKDGQPTPYWDNTGNPGVNPGAMLDHAHTNTFYCHTDGQELLVGDR